MLDGPVAALRFQDAVRVGLRQQFRQVLYTRVGCGGSFVVDGGLRKGPAMLQELGVSEMRYRAVLEVLDGAVISDVARRYGVSRQTVHSWLRRYAREGAVLNLEDRSSRPHGCPHQMAPVVEARVVMMREKNPRWGLPGWSTSWNARVLRRFRDVPVCIGR